MTEYEKAREWLIHSGFSKTEQGDWNCGGFHISNWMIYDQDFRFCQAWKDWVSEELQKVFNWSKTHNAKLYILLGKPEFRTPELWEALGKTTTHEDFNRLVSERFEYMRLEKAKNKYKTCSSPSCENHPMVDSDFCMNCVATISQEEMRRALDD